MYYKILTGRVSHPLINEISIYFLFDNLKQPKKSRRGQTRFTILYIQQMFKLPWPQLQRTRLQRESRQFEFRQIQLTNTTVSMLLFFPSLSLPPSRRAPPQSHSLLPPMINAAMNGFLFHPSTVGERLLSFFLSFFPCHFAFFPMWPDLVTECETDLDSFAC